MRSQTPYDPQTIEQEAQHYWEQKQTFKAKEDLTKEKCYCLTMFPYPSGSLHMGHVRCYTLGDVISRYQRMLGKNVLQPIGWDAFGLPAENAAMKHKIHPAQWTYQQIDKMRKQFKRLGNAYDWQRELTTCKPEYYHWEQWFFLKLYEKGLVYKKNAVVNWDPVDQTVLANEQVVDGRGWRSGAPVERREIPQWFIKITAYAEELLTDLKKLENWPKQVLTMQKNWIGRSQGAEVHFTLLEHHDSLKIFTTRVDTLMGVSYLAIAPNHPLAKQLAKKNPEVATFIEEHRNIKVAEASVAILEKQGIDTGITASHPVNQQRIPVWIANFVLMEYGSGAIMGVPAHDQRDFEFAKKYQLPIPQVIQAPEQHDFNSSAYTEKGILINSEQFDGLTSQQAILQITEHLVKKQQADEKVQYRLRDWSVSRQRYWGTPIPIINCATCGTIPVPEDQLPVVLPEEISFSGTGSPLKDLPQFINTTCPKCNAAAERETDTFDTFVESSWYYARFACPDQDKAMLDDRVKYWTPVDYYVGGIEHAVMHLLYARFFHKLLRDLKLLNGDEPFQHLLTQGMVLKDGNKMSKSKGNIVDPDALIERYGVDTVRLFTMFAAPPEQTLEWSDSGVEGAHRFLKKLWQFAEDYHYIKTLNEKTSNGKHATIDWAQTNDKQKNHRHNIYLILKHADTDYQRCHFNTIVSDCMKLLNILSEIPADSNDTLDQYTVLEGFSILLRLLAPITPHICHKLWQECQYGDSISDATWPSIDKKALKLESIEYVIQVNGKLRGHITVAESADEDTVLNTALAHDSFNRYIDDKVIQKAIFLPQRKLLNLVVQ